MLPRLRPMVGASNERDTEVRSVVLDALIAGQPIDDIADAVRPYHGPTSTYPAAALLDLAADAYLACGSTRGDRLDA